MDFNAYLMELLVRDRLAEARGAAAREALAAGRPAAPRHRLVADLKRLVARFHARMSLLPGRHVGSRTP